MRIVDLRKVEEIRFDDPMRAEPVYRRAVERSSGIETARWCGVRGSCLRQLSRLREAKAVLTAGFRVAVTKDDPWGEADILQRIAFLLGANARFDESMLMTDRAIGGFLSLGERHKVAECLADRAQWLFQLGQIQQSLQANRNALLILAADQTRHRYACLLGTAYGRAELGDIKGAIKAAQTAATLPVKAMFAGSARVLVGDLLEKTGRHLEAARFYHSAAQTFIEVNPHEAALAAARWTRAELIAGSLIPESERELLGALLLRSSNRQIEAALLEISQQLESRRNRQRIAEAVLTIEQAVRGRPRRDRPRSTVYPLGSG
jgi:tetratricopeptide (TPR) repeat protein